MALDPDIDAFTRAHAVSRETLDRLRAFADELTRWTRRINLISERDASQIWRRHITDSAQLWPMRPIACDPWLDLGSGGGFPGVVLAVLAMAEPRTPHFHLIESDTRKAAFLASVSRRLALPCTVHPVRIEAYRGPKGRTVTARALAPLRELIPLIDQVRLPDGRALLPKGRTLNIELDAARTLWDFEYWLHPSRTDAEAGVIEIGAIHGKR